MNKQMITFIAVIALSACTVSKQKKIIDVSRQSIVAVDDALLVVDDALTKHYEEVPIEDAERLCEAWRFAIALETILQSLQIAEQTLHIWETAVNAYDAGTGSKDQITVASKAFFQIASDLISMTIMLVELMEDAGVEIPASVASAFALISGIGDADGSDFNGFSSSEFEFFCGGHS
jgi:hypothetical protein